MNDGNELGEESAGPGDKQVELKVKDGRFQPPNPNGLTPALTVDLGLIVDGVVSQRLQKDLAHGLPADAAMHEPRQIHDAAAPSNPVEAMVLRSMVLASAQQRQLLDLSARAKMMPDSQRYAALALKAAREVSRSAAVWDALRKPPRVHIGNGAQANIVGGDQVINSGERE